MSILQNTCKCDKCVEQCQSYPGWMTPSEALIAIEKGFGDKLMLDFFSPDDSYKNEYDIFVLCPAWTGYEQQEAPFDIPSNTPCIMLINELCSIHDSGFKPKQCRETFGCIPEMGPAKRDIIPEWDTDHGRSVVQKWKDQFMKENSA